MKNSQLNRVRRHLPLLILVGLASHAPKADAGQGVWTTNGPYGVAITALAINPSDSATLYAGTWGGGVFKSTDGGGSWTATNTGPTSTDISALAIDTSAPATLYAGTASWDGPSEVFKSIDGGAHWGTCLTSGSVFALVIDPFSPHTLYAGTRGGVFKSTNGGANWTAVNVGLTNSDIFSLAITPSAPATLFAGTEGGIFKSTNGGLSWSATGVGPTNVYALVIDPLMPSNLYAGVYGAGIFKSINSGETWTAANTGLTALGVTTLMIDPTNPATVYAGTTGSGVFKSADGGESWTAVNAGLTSLVVEVLQIDPTHPGTLYAGTSGGVFKIIGGGEGVWLLPASVHASGVNGAFYTTNISVANTGALAASFVMKFLGHDQDGSGGPEKTFDLEVGRSVTYLDVLGSFFNQTSNFGAIRITSDTPSLNVVSVTSTPGFGGTLSQTTPVVSLSNLIPAGSPRSILYIREGDGFRSNLILASNANVPTTVDATLVSPAGTTLAAKSYSVPPNGMRQINRIVRDMGVSGPITGARLVLASSTPNAAFTGFASVIDETTNDPTAVEAR